MRTRRSRKVESAVAGPLSRRQAPAPGRTRHRRYGLSIGVTGSLIGVRIRNRIDAEAFRIWVKRALFVIALGLLLQYTYSRLA